MRIAQVAPLHERVPPVLYGGTERVVSYLTEELVRLGHEVTLFASGDSITRARLEPFAPRALRLDRTCKDPLAPHVRMLAHVYARSREFDVIHCHTDYLALPFTRYSSTPTVMTLHGRLDLGEIHPLYRDYREVPLVSISDTQRRPMPDVNWVATVPHGLPLDLYAFQPERGAYLLFLGRVSPEKCADAAIRIARRAGLPLKIAAKVDAVDREYFETRIRPLLGGRGVEFLGEVDDAAKRELLRGALALLFPIDWPEPFGLVMIEALACGTPVVARRRGSVAEVLRDGETGMVCETEDEMIDAVRRVGALDRRRCREDFESRFTAARMARDYERVYRAVCLPGAAQRSRAPRAGVQVPRPTVAGGEGSVAAK